MPITCSTLEDLSFDHAPSTGGAGLLLADCVHDGKPCNEFVPTPYGTFSFLLCGDAGCFPACALAVFF
ncbi:MAG: hypothetical protein OES29_13400 [Desulfuromonadales bacterium]|nr:hypothetical protein [Desulfuromonadales bacterium]